ncbi:hypothetical protein BJ944DRAFT_259379 [Cunninghamella echinulata]|nr:hypothetical protein BJ944DRAFT_259379 [Cunninghamella echinulata]
MASPPDSITDIDDAASKKRGRAQSVEPVAPPKDEVETDKSTTVSAPKKTKRDETVKSIRKNLKDMTTTDKSGETDDTMAGDSQEVSDIEDVDDHVMETINEEELQQQGKINKNQPLSLDENKSSTSDLTRSASDISNNTMSQDQNLHVDNNNNNNNASKSFAQFGGKKKDDDDWSEFAEDDEEDKKKVKPVVEEKPKYTFGSTSGFGTKGWASLNQSTPVIQKTTASFSGFSSKPFGAFSTNNNDNSNSTSSTTVTTTNTNTKTALSFSAFSKAPTTSPFALAAATSKSGLNSLASLPKTALSPGDSNSVTSPDTQDEKSDYNGSQNGDDEKQSLSTEHTFGEEAKLKVPGIKPTEVKTGEEDEDTVYHTKAKLLILDTKTNNWKERGSGTLHINVKEIEEKNTTQTRLIMRADSVYRLILNLLLFAEMKVFIMQERFVRFAGFESEQKEDGTSEPKLVNYALKVANPAAAKELHDQIKSRIPNSSN